MSNIANNIKYTNKLSEKIFKDEILKEDVRLKLIKTLYFFVEQSKSEKHIIINDLILTGSMANFNYNETSDIDLHIMMDKNVNNMFSLLDAESKFFNLKYSDLNIGGHNLEIYIQDINEKHNSSGLYSILKNEWILKPKFDDTIKINKELVNSKYDSLKDKIDYLIETEIDLKIIKKFIDKLKDFRKLGLSKEGEFSVENLVFKLLRSNGYIEKLYDYLKTLEVKNIV